MSVKLTPYSPASQARTTPGTSIQRVGVSLVNPVKACLFTASTLTESSQVASPTERSFVQASNPPQGFLQWAYNWNPYWNFPPGHQMHTDWGAMSNAHSTLEFQASRPGLPRSGMGPQMTRAPVPNSPTENAFSYGSRRLPEGDRGSIIAPSFSGVLTQHPRRMDDTVVCSYSGSHTVIEKDTSEEREIKKSADDKMKCTSPQRFATLNFETLTMDQAIFYFGVIALEKALLPRFHLSSSRHTGHWGVKLTLYGHTLVRSHVYKSPKEAKADVCRDALRSLSVDHPEWAIPLQPNDLPATSARDWVEISRDCCMLNGLCEPEYTKYKCAQGRGYFHKVKFRGVSYFGPQDRGYRSEYDSQNAAAHLALYTWLISDSDDGHTHLRYFASNRSNGRLLELAPRASSDVGNWQTLPKRLASAALSNEGGRSHKRRKEQIENSNTLPVANCRLAPIEVHVEKEEPMWKLAPCEIIDQLQGLKSHSERLERVCQLLSLKPPEIRIERLGRRPIESVEGEYSAAAYFQDQPFLVRAGAIGRVEINGTKIEAQEACAEKVAEYLIEMVEEDTRAPNADED
ncbi:hypothetical protein BDV28DRAFT_152261 [Aspergillus coremiiformis]|uniref:Uncharacterized protein n=1 Tax=Aspergillus coremiiformis TaxID=138285 RepID=A0A5N6YZ96_9EURO|nr:hypothetical protein BDV28DRAFT_152261 [Aspergillus coremiiformis]